MGPKQERGETKKGEHASLSQQISRIFMFDLHFNFWSQQPKEVIAFKKIAGRAVLAEILPTSRPLYSRTSQTFQLMRAGEYGIWTGVHNLLYK